jgi:hypothetical protein
MGGKVKWKWRNEAYEEQRKEAETAQKAKRLQLDPVYFFGLAQVSHNSALSLGVLQTIETPPNKACTGRTRFVKRGECEKVCEEEGFEMNFKPEEGPEEG